MLSLLVMRMDEVATDPHFEARGLLAEVEQPGSDRPISIARVPIKLTVTPGGVHRRGSSLGEHTEEILRVAGVVEARIAMLVQVIAKQRK